jgi:hypothetical protein
MRVILRKSRDIHSQRNLRLLHRQSRYTFQPFIPRQKYCRQRLAKSAQRRRMFSARSPEFAAISSNSCSLMTGEEVHELTQKALCKRSFSRKYTERAESRAVSQLRSQQTLHQPIETVDCGGAHSDNCLCWKPMPLCTERIAHVFFQVLFAQLKQEDW